MLLHALTHTHKELLGDYITVSPALTSSLIISRGSIFGNLIRVIISVRTQVFAWADNKNQRRQAAVGKSGSIEPARRSCLNAFELDSAEVKSLRHIRGRSNLKQL